MLLPVLRRKLDRLLIEYLHAEQTAKDEETALGKAKEHEKDVLEAQQMFQGIAEKVQNSAHERIAQVVTRCLETVFSDPYEFKVVFEKRRGRTEAKPVFIRDGNILEDPLHEAGGGTIDIAAFALQLVDILLSQPPKRRFIALDEPFHWLHGTDNRTRIRQLLKEITKEMKFQVLIVSADSDLAAGKIIELD